MVLGVAAFALVDRLDVLDELDRLDPLDHLEAELILDTQPQRGSVQMIERLVVHLVRQQCLRVQSVLDREAVVILAARDARAERDALAKRVEDDRLRIGSRPDQFHQFRQRQSAPRGNARPALDAVVQRDLGLLAQRPEVVQRQFDRVLHQAVYLEPVVLEIAGGQRLPLVAGRHLAVDPEEGRDVFAAELGHRGGAVEKEPHHRADDRLGGVLDGSGVPPRQPVGEHVQQDDHADPHQTEVQADRVGIVRAHDDVVHVPDEPGEHHHGHVHDDE